MALLLLDLDNTLLDRAGAFQVWAVDFLQRIGAPADELAWILDVDADGLANRWDVAEALKDRYRLRTSSIDLVESLHDGMIQNVRLDPLVACALKIAADAGWVPVVVSNGSTRQQEAKIRHTGLDRYLADWVISEEAGVSKPNPRIFAIAAERGRMRLNGAWMMGDSPEADIGGASALGLPSVWLHRGRQWAESRFAPTRIADGPIAALAAVFEKQSTDNRSQHSLGDSGRRYDDRGYDDRGYNGDDRGYGDDRGHNDRDYRADDQDYRAPNRRQVGGLR